MAHGDEAARYRKAAREALAQLDWCVEYIRGLRKTKLSKQIAKNRSDIARRLAPPEDDRQSRT